MRRTVNNPIPRNAVRTCCAMREERGRKKPWDTVGELGSAGICGSHMPSWNAKKLGETYARKSGSWNVEVGSPTVSTRLADTASRVR
jgi:hypothetical protein